MGLKYLAVTIAADKANNPENIWILAGAVTLIGLLFIARWARKRNKG